MGIVSIGMVGEAPRVAPSTSRRPRMAVEQHARVLVFERDDALRAQTCSWVEAAGYPCVGVARPDDAGPQLLNPDLALVVHGVSPPCTWADITADHLALGELPCALALHGDRPDEELAELAWACRAASHARLRSDGSDLI